MAPIFRKVISAGLSPNTDNDDVWAAIKQLVSFSSWKNGDAANRVESWFKNYSGSQIAVSFNSGRSALFALLKAFGIQSGDEVIVQAFTCVAVPNCVVWCGATPIYVDIDERLNINPKELARLITKRTKAIIVQHTFGIAADMDAIVAVAKKHNLIVIEDCAHSLGNTYKGIKLGTLGDAAFFSFGRDKVLSSVWGGLAVIYPTPRTKSATQKLLAYQENLALPSSAWIAQQLFHPIAASIILPLYNSGIGKLLLVLSQKMHLLSFPVQRMELQGKQPVEFPERYPNALAELLLIQLQKLSAFTQVRKQIVHHYSEKLSGLGQMRVPDIQSESLLRYPLLVENRDEVMRRAKSYGVQIGNWYSHVIDPKHTNFGAIGYVRGSCPKAEWIASRIINLPTRITDPEARIVSDVVLGH